MILALDPGAKTCAGPLNWRWISDQVTVLPGHDRRWHSGHLQAQGPISGIHWVLMNSAWVPQKSCLPGAGEAEHSHGLRIIWFYYKGFHFDGDIILFMEEIIFELFNLPLLSLGVLWVCIAAAFSDCWSKLFYHFYSSGPHWEQEEVDSCSESFSP